MQKRSRSWGLLAAAIGLLTSIGCGTLQAYPGAVRHDSEVALLRCERVFTARLRLLEVNGHPLGPFRDRAEVLPGEISVKAKVAVKEHGVTITAVHFLQLKAEAGREYVLNGDFFLYGPRIWIEDKAQGTVVAEAVTLPSQLPPVGARPRQRRY